MNDIRHSLTVTTRSGVSPVSLIEAKDQARLARDITDEDAIHAAMLLSAVEEVEKDSRRAVLWQRCKLRLDRFPCEILLFRCPVLAIESITYVDTAGDTQTLATSRYQYDISGEPARIQPAYGLDWPTVREDTLNAVTVTFTAGYAAPFTVVPSTDIATVTGLALTSGDVYRLSNTGGNLPDGLSLNTDYHLRDVSGQTCKFAASSGGSAIDLVTEGSGTHLVGEVPEILKQAVRLRFAMSAIEREGMAFEKYERAYWSLIHGAGYC